MPTTSARRAGWLLGGGDSVPAPEGPISEGEAERLELVDTIATHMHIQARAQTFDARELAVYRRLLEHLRGPLPDETSALGFQ